jgi:hypothetical protein
VPGCWRETANKKKTYIGGDLASQDAKLTFFSSRSFVDGGFRRNVY